MHVANNFDQRWRERALAGDETAVRQLAQEALEPLYAFCLYRVGKRADVCEEVVQETLLAAIDQIERYDPVRSGGHVFPWLTGLARNAIRRELARLRAPASLEAMWIRMDRDLHGRDHTYLNVFPSKKTQEKARQRLRELTSPKHCFRPIPALIQMINRYLRGWSNYFDHGYPRVAFRGINAHVRNRVAVHLRRRSQRRFRPPKDRTLYGHLKSMGLLYL